MVFPVKGRWSIKNVQLAAFFIQGTVAMKGNFLNPPKGMSDLQGIGTELADQAEKAALQGTVSSLERSRENQRSLGAGFYACSADRSAALQIAERDR